MDKLRRLCGSKSITGYRDKDLSKRDYSLSSRIFIISILILLLFALTAPPGSAGITVEKVRGWDAVSQSWTPGNLAGWKEGDCVPYYFLVGNTGTSSETASYTLNFDWKDSDDTLGVLDFENKDFPAGTLEGPYYESGTGVLRQGIYYWNVTVPADTTYNVTWCARLSDECSQWNGAKLHVNVWTPGKKDVPINTPGAGEVPDLYASKSATVTCNAITYTISYGNQGGQNQTNTVLVDDYDETKVTITNAGGGTDSGTNITWNIGTVNISETGSVSYTVSIKSGVASGTVIVNTGNISGRFVELDTADNIYTVTSSAKVNPVANFTSNSPQIYCYGITFNGTATGGTAPYTYYWDFGDGSSSSTEQNPSHSYSAAGTYDVTLTVTDANGCTNSTTKPVVASGYTTGLSITKKANVTSATVGTVIGYTINVTNTGNVNLTSVHVSDSLTGLSQTIPNLTPGAPQTFNTAHTVTESEICAPISNTATANGTDPCGLAVGPVHATVIVTQGYATGLSVVKDANVTSAATVGTVIGYTINVSNTGNVNLTNVLVTDSLTCLYATIPILAPGAFQIFKTTYTVTESDLCGSPPRIENTATANGTDPCGYLTLTAQGVFSVSGGYTATLSITKEANVTSATVGTVIGYTINVNNTGNVDLTSVLVTDVKLGLSETITTLAAGATRTFNPTYTVTQSDICAPINNTATANGTDQCGRAVGPESASVSVDSVYNADLSIVKTVSLTGTCPGSDPLAVNIGDTVTYCFNVSNTGDVDLTNVAVVDNIHGPVTLATTTLAPGETTGGTLTHVVVELDAPSVTNIATATGTDPCSVTVTDIDDCTIDVAIAPDIEVNKTASLTGSCPGSDPLAVSVGDTVTYCFNVTNTGDVTLIGVTVNDDIYGAVTLGTTTLAPGESTEGTLTHVVVELDAPSVTDTATATGTDPLGDTITDTDDCMIDVAIAPGIEVVKTASLTGTCPGSDPLAVSIGDTVTYCFNVTNTGDVTLIGVTVNDDIYGAVALGTTTLAPGESTEGTLTHVVVELDAPSVTDIATATGTDPLGDTITDTDDCMIDVAIAPGIEVVKTASLTGTCPGSDPLAVSVGDTVTYCFNVSNTGDVNLTNVAVVDGIYGPVTLGTTTLAPGERTEGTITHIVVESDAPSVTNIATATGTDPLAGTVTDADACMINVAIAPGIEVVKTASLTGTCPGSDPLAVSVGDTVTYCFNVSNTGDVNLTNVAVVDDIYGPVTLGTTTLAPGETTEGTITHIVVESDAPSVTDTATATGTDPLLGTVTDTDDCMIDVAIAPGIEVVKTASLTGTCPGSDPLAVSVGDTVTYCFNVSNTGDVNLTNVAVVDSIHGPVTLGTTTLAPGESTEGTLTHVVVESDAPSVTNIATAKGTDPLAGTVTDADACMINVAIAPGIEVVKTASLTGTCPGSDPLAVNIGDTVTYCFNVSNTGDVNLTNVAVVDNIHGPVTLGTTTLAPGETTGGTVTHVVVESDAPSVTDIATATGTDPLAGTVTDTDVCTIDVVIAPGIEVVKTASLTGSCPGSDPLDVSVGDTVTYCFNVSNTGDVNLTNVAVVDNIHGSVTLGTTTLAPGETTGGTVMHVVVASDAPLVTNIATATGTDPLTGTVTDTDDCIIDVAIAPGIEVVKTASLTGSCPGSDPLAVSVGDTVTYCFNVSNTGNVDLTNVAVVDNIYGSVTLGTTTLAPGESTEGTLTHVVVELDAPSVTDIATATGTDPLLGTVTDTDDCIIDVAIAPGIEVVKTASLTGTCPGSDPLAVSVGDTVTYCFNVTNTGDVTLIGVTVNDDIYGAVTLGTTTLAPGESTGGTLTHVVVESDAPSVTDIATATGTDPLGDTITDTDDCIINVAIAPGIEVVKTASLTGTCPGSDPLAVSVGDTVTYCFNVSNTGDVTLIGVTVNDDIYGAVTLGTTTLAPGESTGGTLTHVVVESDAPSVTDIATATGTDPLGDTITDTDDCIINVAIAPGIEVVKTASLTGTCPGSDPLAVSVGDTVTYCFNVSNTGDVTLIGVTVNDDIYGAVTLGTTTLAPGESTEGTLTHVVVELDAPSVTDIATATGTDPLGDTITDTDDCIINVAIAPGIEVVKTASLTGTCPGSDPLAVSVGDTVTYCFNVTNTGDVTLIGVTVNDDIYGAVTLGTTTLAPGESTEGTITHVVVELDAPSVTDTATATGTDPLGDTITDTDDCIINVAIAPGIEVVKTASLTGTCPGSDPLAVSVGDTVTYCFNVTNTGDVTLIGVTVNDDIYGAVTLGTTTLAPGESTEGTITHVVVELDAPSVTDIATATGTDPLGDTIIDTDDCIINVAIAPGIEVVKTASLTGTCPGSDPLAVSVGDTVTYCFNVSNTGDVTLIGVTVNDDIYGAVTLGTTTLAPGESTEGTITHVVVELDAPSVTDIATATGTDPLGDTIIDTDDCIINVAIAPGIEVVKTASLTGSCPGSDPLAVSVGDTVTYCFNVSNTGDVTLSGITVNDDIYGAVTLGTTTLAPGERTEGTITHIVVESDAPSVIDTATATGTPPVGAEVTDTDDCMIDVKIHPEVELEKSSSPTTVAPGGNVTYTINYTNTGEVPLTNVVITENYPEGVTFISASPAPDAGTNNVWTIGTLLPGESGTIVIKVKVPEQIDLSFTETGSVIGEGVVMITKDLSTEQKPYSLRNSVTLSCDELAPVRRYATTKVSGVPGTSLGITEHGSGIYESEENLDLQTKNKSIILKKSTNAEYKPTSFNFSDSFSVNFTNKWKQDICSKNMEIDAAIHKKISDATYIDDETISRVDKDKSIMNFDSSFNGSLHIGARTKDTEISETYIGEFDVLQTIHIAKGPIPTPAPTPTPTPIWLPCPFNASQEMNITEDAEPTHDAKIKIEMSANRTSATVGDVIRYSYVVTNIGNINLTGVTVKDSNLGLVDLNRTELEPTEVANGTLLYTVNQSDVCANITNTADVMATDGCGDPVTNTSNQVIVTTDS